MPTKLSRYCEGIIEAAWLAAIILVPIFFNIYSSRIFEPDKLTILRSLALLILGAWIVKLVDEGGIRWDRLEPEHPKTKFIINFPLVMPVLVLASLYLVSTIFSIAPRTSLLGSYQRLQGTYTTYSYLLIFAAILCNVRRRVQVERIITTIVLTSLPIALYGILQHYKIDPIPWAGDTSIRIAANMGNSIFVAAYLIMVFPLTIGRIVQAFNAILKEDEHLWSQVSKATIYVFAAAVQIIALYMSGSRGPALGWLAGSFFLFLLLSLYWRKRGLTVGTIATALAMAAFLIVFNIPGGPLEGLRQSPAIGRFGLLLDPDSNSALVRKYIWQGAAELVKPHAPLEYPDGHKDTFNFLRPLIGYGPETMYVAYNPFYVPELAIVERRNASPDRSHNETWDALVITGGLGIFGYLFLFTMVIYYGLKWIGLVTGKKQRNLFLLLWLGIGVGGGGGLSVWRGFEYFGVGLPFGMLIGLLVYLTIVAVYGAYRPPEGESESARYLILIVLIAAIVSHFVEINFGIAIAATRTYFWVYTALLVVVGYILPKIGVFDIVEMKPDTDELHLTADEKKSGTMAGKKKKRARSGVSSAENNWLVENRQALISAFIILLVLVTLGFDFINNPPGLKSAPDIVWSALTRLPSRNLSVSFGILWVFLTAWLFAGVVLVTEHQTTNLHTWWKGFAITFGVAFFLALFYGLWHAGRLAEIARNSASTLDDVLVQVGRFEGLLPRYYFAVLLIILAMAVVLSEPIQSRSISASPATIIATPILSITVILLAFITNIRVVQADIVFKITEPFSRGGQWPVAIAIYNRANELAPNEDYYYLFLGRAFLEHAKTLQDTGERDRFIKDAEAELLKAQALNPLNTDHTANLARLFSLWASFAPDLATGQQRGEISSNYFSRAVTLSRNSAMLWDEWAYLFLTILQKPDEAYQKIEQALTIDPEYHRSYALLGEYYLRKRSSNNTASVNNENLKLAAQNYEKALSLPTPSEPTAKFNYSQILASIYAEMGQYSAAIDAYQQAIKIAPKGAEVWKIHEALANLYIQNGDTANALLHLQDALSDAPADQKDRLRALTAQLQPASQP